VKIEELDILKVFGKPFEGPEGNMFADRHSISHHCTNTTSVGKECGRGRIHGQMKPRKVPKGSMSKLPSLGLLLLIRVDSRHTLESKDCRAIQSNVGRS
jgi:hypothetical protein